MSKPINSLKLDPSIVNKVGVRPAMRTKFEYVVWKFLQNPIEANWPREISLAKMLYKKFPEMEFWEAIEGMDKVGSLTWLMVSQKLYELQGMREKFINDGVKLKDKDPIQYNEDGVKLGEDAVITTSKPKTAFDFIKNV